MATVLKDKIVTTRKEHRCFACLRKFPAGTEMNYWFIAAGYDTGGGYTCETCQQIMGQIDLDEYYDGFVLESLNKDQTPEQYLQELINSKNNINQLTLI